MENSSNDSPELLALFKLDESSLSLQKQGKYLKALEVMERALVLRQHFFGKDSLHVIQACKTVSELCNLLAMTYLQKENLKSCYELLRKAEILSLEHPRIKAVTFNNLACYFRKRGKLYNALKYLELALKIENYYKDNEKEKQYLNKADTHLNLCAVLSQLGRHSGALEQAQTALILLQEEMIESLKLSTEELLETGIRIDLDRVAVLCIAYHNVGVEQEFLKKLHLALISYKKGLDLAKEKLCQRHGVYITLNNSYLTAKRALAIKERKAKLSGKRDEDIEALKGATNSNQYKVFNKRHLAKKEKSQVYFENSVEIKETLDVSKWNQMEKAYGFAAREVRPKKKVVKRRKKKLKDKTVKKNIENEIEGVLNKNNESKRNLLTSLSTEYETEFEADLIEEVKKQETFVDLG
eukprot:maker-scaffold_28-snap-gene-2.43-mRNA-1 protein AED:0.00 eAED:0.00 QI:732/1/1/1/1/0.66/3/256/410